MTDLEQRINRLRLFCAVQLPANYQSIQADIDALLQEYDRLRETGEATDGR